MAKRGRVTARSRQPRARMFAQGTHMLPTEVTMRRELIDGQDAVVVQFETVNVTFAVPMAVSGWEQFIEDLKQIMVRGKIHERSKEQTTGSGLVLPSGEDVDEHGGLPRLRQ